ncbi:MAG: hypothetical protein AAF074_25825 [Pseudomonadota bacterium]
MTEEVQKTEETPNRVRLKSFIIGGLTVVAAALFFLFFAYEITMLRN